MDRIREAMKAILEFDLDNPDDIIAHMRAVKSLDMVCVLSDITHNLKKKCINKHDNSQEVIDDIFNEIFEILNAHNINIDELLN